MSRSDSVLVVDDSRVVRELALQLMAPHFARIHVAESCAEAKRVIGEHRDVGLVLCDVCLPDGSGFDVLGFARSLPEGPRVVMLTARPSDDDERRALDAGALGYLSKPFNYQALAGLLQRGTVRREADRRVRPPLARAHLLDVMEAAPLVTCEVRDLSVLGAFLETPGPIPVGASFRLVLDIGDGVLRPGVEVVRLQAPGWGRVGGVAVRYVDMSPEDRRRLQEFLAGR